MLSVDRYVGRLYLSHLTRPALPVVLALWCTALTLMLGSPARASRFNDGNTRTANKLINENSPYLLLHAYNPVDWYPWGDEALSKARYEAKPIFLSVGYSTCYWCHVIERLVFSNPQIADLMNQWFVNVKVDREERPDIDKIYMWATQLLTGGGGWPNSVFLTPDLKPFYAGTYFPPEDSHGKPSFLKVLTAIHDAWENRRDQVVAVSEQLTSAIRELESGSREPPGDPDRALVELAQSHIEGRYDARFGGFGGAPKFPSSMRLDFLLSSWTRNKNENTWRIVERSLEAMAHGGIYDQVGWGFHRYATDAEWRVPQFEKMLYNQAGLGRLYLRAFEFSGRQSWRALAVDILAFVEHELTAPEGPFYSALDAETETVEGKYYLWTADEIGTALGADAKLFHELYELVPVPETGSNAVVRRQSVDSGSLPAAKHKRWLDMRRHLMTLRGDRIYPLRDDKVITSWNGMMIETYAEAYRVLRAPEYKRSAESAATFILEQMRRPDGRLFRVYRQGERKYAAYLEDYAFLARGLLSLYGATGDPSWMRSAREVVELMLERFWDAQDGGFYFTEGGNDLLVRIKDGQDSALPSATAVAIAVLLDLTEITGDSAYRDTATRCLRLFGGAMRARPLGFVRMISAADRYLTSTPKEKSIRLPAKLISPSVGQVVEAEIRMANKTPAPGQEFALGVDLSISPGWHLYAPASYARSLRPTSMTLNSDLPVMVLDIDYPASKLLFNAALGESLSVYEGRVDLRILIQYQACADPKCLPPAELQERVSLTVSEEQ